MHLTSSIYTRALLRILTAILLLAGLIFQPLLGISTARARGSTTDIVGPAGSGAFGTFVYPLANGNIVIVDPEFDLGTTADVGAVYLYDGQTLALISTLTGSQVNDRVGEDGVALFKDGSFAVQSPSWDNNTAVDAGALTWCSATSGCSGAVSAANSLVGSTGNDWVGRRNSIEELPNGGYLVATPTWDNNTALDAGALTRCGAAGCIGVISATNSLVGSAYGDAVGISYSILPNGHYLALTPYWNNRAGAVTWCDGSVGCKGFISETNSLIGTSADDYIGYHLRYGQNGNYVLASPQFDMSPTITDSGAVTWCSGSSGCRGFISEANSLLGRKSGDRVGQEVLSRDTGYLVFSPDWDNGSTTDVGAVTWCSYAAGCKGDITASNSLLGASPEDHTGSSQVWGPAFKDDYLVLTPDWHTGSNSQVGAVTYCDGSQGGCTGTVRADNSLTGVITGDGDDLEIALDVSTGNYMVMFPNFGTGDTGLVTWCSRTSPCTGEVQPTESLTGSSVGDHVGIYGEQVAPGVYLLASYNWNGGETDGRGAVTLCTLTSCQNQMVSPANSLVGDRAGDHVGSGSYVISYFEDRVGYLFTHRSWHNASGAVTYCQAPAGSAPPCRGVISADNALVGQVEGEQIGSDITDLGNGAYLVISPDWSNNGLANVGAVTWCPQTGCTGVISAANSLVGTHAGDQVGKQGTLELYQNGSGYTGRYVVQTAYWDNDNLADAGALTFCGLAGCRGPVSSANSLVGSTAGELLGYESPNTPGDNTYVLRSPNYIGETGDAVGAVVWCNGVTGCTGAVPAQRGVIPGNYRENYPPTYFPDPAHNRLIVGRPADQIVTILDAIYSLYLPNLSR